MSKVKEAELHITMHRAKDQANGIAETAQTRINYAETEFQAIGLKTFFDTDVDSQVDWIEVFDASAVFQAATMETDTSISSLVIQLKIS